MHEASSAITEQALSLMRNERWTEAIKLLKSELPLAGANWRLSWNLGWCYFKLDRFEQAQKHLTRAAVLAPENAICAWALGSVYLKRKQFRKAERNLVKSLRIKDLYIARISLALTYLEQGGLVEAETVHLEGIRLKPQESRRYESYACFLSDAGREQEARKMYKKAKKLRGIA